MTEKNHAGLSKTHRKHLHCIDILLRSLCCVLARIVELEALEISTKC